MCKDDLHSFLARLPKVEQHMHVEGSLMPATLFKLAAQHNITLPQDDPAYKSEEALLERYRHFDCLDDFLHYYYTGMSVLLNEGDFEALAWAYFQRAHQDGVVHAEIFFDPQAHTSRGVSFDTVVKGMDKARQRARQELRLSSELICCFLRHLPVPQATELFADEAVQRAFKAGTVCGIGLDSSEKAFPPEHFKGVYAKAKAQGLRVTAHAGEEGPWENIAASLDTLGCERIDHGVRLAENEALMKRIAAQGTLLTVCPLSNVLLRCFERVADMPIRKFLDAGVHFSINSDDPAYLGGFILDNFCAVQDAFGLSVGEWSRICSAAIAGSWCGDARKAEMTALLNKVVHEHAAA